MKEWNSASVVDYVHVAFSPLLLSFKKEIFCLQPACPARIAGQTNPGAGLLKSEVLQHCLLQKVHKEEIFLQAMLLPCQLRAQLWSLEKPADINCRLA